MRLKDILQSLDTEANTSAARSAARTAGGVVPVEDADFIVVGGGVYGAAIAYELVVRGSSVTLLEADHLASRASGGPGKRAVRANTRNSRELSFAREALALWPSLSEELGSDTGFERL